MTRLITRRTFVRSIGAALAASGLGTILQPGIAFSLPCSAGSGPIRNYIRINLLGGVDGLHLFVPRDNRFSALQSLRPTLMGSTSPFLAAPSQSYDLGLPYGVHPLWGPQPELQTMGLKSIGEILALRQGRILPNYGFPVPDLNHVTAAQTWALGERAATIGSALHWQARLRQQFGLDWYQMWVLGEQNGYRDAAGQTPAIAARQLRDLRRFNANEAAWGWRQGSKLGGAAEVNAAQLTLQRILELPDEPDISPAKRAYKDGMLSAWSTVNDIVPNSSTAAATDPSHPSNILAIQNVSLPTYFPVDQYPNIDPLFQDVLRVIHHYRITQSTCRSSPLMMNINMFGFDTHEGQAGRMHGCMRGISHCIGALHRYLTENGLWNETIIHFVSDFGREIVENPSAGTSHGFGNVLFLLGGAVDPQGDLVVGGTGMLPSLTQLQGGVLVQGSTMKLLPVTLDARSVQWSIVRGMGFNPAPIFPGYTPQEELSLFRNLGTL